MMIFLVNEEAFWGFHFRVHFSGWRGGGFGWRRSIRAFHFPHGGPLLHPDPRQVTFVISSVFTNNIQTMFMTVTTTSYVCTHKKGGQAGIVTKRTIFSCCPGHRYYPYYQVLPVLPGFTRYQNIANGERDVPRLLPLCLIISSQNELHKSCYPSQYVGRRWW